MRTCPACNQPIRDAYKVPLSKNNVSVLWHVFLLMKKKQYAENGDIIGLPVFARQGASPTAEMSRLKFLGAVVPFFTPKDVEKESTRSGKYAITREGLLFLKGTGMLPSYVLVKDKKVVEKGKGVKINDPSLKFHTEDDIWKVMKEYWDEGKGKEVQVNLFNFP